MEREIGMLEKLKKKSIVKALPAVIILFIAGIVLIGLEVSNLKSLMKGHVKFETLAPDEINGDLIVDASIDVNFGSFMEEYEENTKTHATRTTSLYYIIWTGDEDSEDFKYMGIKVPASDERKMEEMADATYNYEYSDPIEYSGAVNKMSSQEYEYFKEYFLESDWSEEEFEEYTLPYYISVGALTGGAATTVYGVVGIGVILIVIGLIMLIHALTGGKLKSFKKEIEDSGFSVSDVEFDYESAKLFNKGNDLRIGRRFIFYMSGNKPHILLNDQVIWAYQQNTTHRTNGIKTGTTHEILVYLLNNKKVAHIYVPKEDVGTEVLQYINQLMPRAVVGYSDELVRLYQKDYQGFLQLRYNAPEQQYAESRETAEPMQNQDAQYSEQQPSQSEQ